MTTAAVTLHGSCHCGRLHADFSTALDLANVTPRACDCSFCRKHGAAYISDPAGALTVSATQNALRRYRQGANNADFLVCAHCGVLVAVVFEHDSRLYGAVNAGCLDGSTGLGRSVPASPQTLRPDERMSRWLQLWIPEVQVKVSDGTHRNRPGTDRSMF